MKQEQINRLTDLLCQKVGGDWLLAGGSLVVLEFGGSRATEDVDLVNIQHEVGNNLARVELFKEAKTLGFIPEQVNSAVDFYVKQCEGWQDHVVLIREGARGRVFRPSLTLFLALKLNRGSEIDIEDCRLALKTCVHEVFRRDLFLKWTTREAQEKLSRLAGDFSFELSSRLVDI